MQGNETLLTLDEIATAKAVIRVLRFLTVLGTAAALPFAVVLLTPLMGWALLAALVLSPLLVAYVFVAAARQAEEERRRARA